ncbi:very-long-chain 3-oxoacyl-CoA synthase [Synchytrium endobioticum]|uniref:Elongation of fatty acids protein n=1 Tax=Synchytrium endobioticum TaxID=286115 RepID=A0A507BVM5_9FUNG|nr:very-long-chain 3-oxoacyl-CoA synthase [Synchytrium endobioticum]TPX50177.1 very-long-chain 3-oxoacyl-CoA synthase [Synchytrium endobioticum]
MGILAYLQPTNKFLDITLARTMNWSPDEFKFHFDLPFGRGHVCVAMCVGYLMVMFAGTQIMKSHKPFELKQLVFVHNVIMSAGSLILWLLVAEQVFSMWIRHGFAYVMCNKEAYTPRLELFYYWNYIFKLWEFIDTIFLVLKKRPLEFLHVYHHSATAGFAYLFLWKPTSSTWVVVVLNLAVHVFMYYYYAVSTVSKRNIWWKKHLTTMQISQFVLDIAMVTYMSYNIFINEYFPWMKTAYGLKTVPNCYAADPVTQASVSGVLFASYLILFIDFYLKTYKKKEARKSEAAAAAALAASNDKSNGTLNGHFSTKEE